MAKQKKTAGTPPFVLEMEQLIAELTASGFARDRFGYTTRLRFTELLNQVSTPEIAENIKFKTAALVCQSAEEQNKFYTVFDSLAARLRAENRKNPPKPPKPKIDKPIIADPVELPPEPPPPPKMPEGGPQPKLVKTVRKGPITIELNFRDDGYRPWNLPGMEEIVRPLREKEPTGLEEWDVPATIRQTIRNGGMLKPMSHRRRRAPQYLFLIEEKGARDHQAGFFADLAIELTRRDLDVEYYFYDHTPTQCWKDRRVPATYTHLERLRVEYPFARLILVGDATAFLALTRKADTAEKKSLAQRQLYPSTLAFHLKEDWELLALMNTRATAIWDEAEETLHSLFPLVPASLKGFGSLMKQWSNRRFLTPHYWKIEHREPTPPALQRFNLTNDQMEEALSELNFYLGSQGFTWLSAISVYPELYWQLTKMLHDEAISENDVPEESLRIQLWHYYLQRLVRLGWLQHGYIPEEFRKILRDKLQPANAADVRRQLLEILQLEENKAPEGSYAEKDQAYTLALFDHERVIALEQPDEIRRKAMEEKLRENVGAQGINISDIEDAVGRNLFERLPEVQAETTKNYWVLWVDDNPKNNLSFQEEVSKEEAIRFVNATSTTHALTTLEVQKFDLIISDVSRHGDKEAGIKMMDKFREAGVKTPVIFFTHPNYVSSSRELLLSKGAVEVVSGFAQLKPIFWEEIAKKRSQNEEGLLKISFLERALTASKAVCRVVLANGSLGTGFLVRGNYLFTCNHILTNPEEAQEAKIEFNYEINAQGEAQQAVEYRLDVSDFMTSPTSALDFTRVKVIDREDAPLSQWGVMELETENIPVENESVILIRHHLGEPKSMDMSETVGVQGQYFYYADQAEKSPGSAGGPILNGMMKAVAIHHARQDNKAILGKTRTVREGVLVRDILLFIEQSQPETTKTTILDRANGLLHQGNEKMRLEAFAEAYKPLRQSLTLFKEAKNDAGRLEALRALGLLARKMGVEVDPVSEIMVPRNEINWVEENANAEFIIQTLEGNNNEHLLICKETLDHVVGFVTKTNYTRNKDKSVFQLQGLLNQLVLYTPISKGAVDLLDSLDEENDYFAVIVDEYGATQGTINLFILEAYVLGMLASPTFKQNIEGNTNYAQQSQSAEPPANEALLNEAASTLDLGREKLKDGDLNAAYELFQKAQALYAEAQYPAGSAETLHETGKLAIQMGNMEEADRSLQSALSLYQSLQFESSQAFVLMDLGRLKMHMSDWEVAEKHYLEAQDLLEGLYGDTEAEQAEIRQALEQIRQQPSGTKAPAEQGAQFKTQFFEAYQAGKLEEALEVLRKVFYRENQEAENQTIQTQGRHSHLKREWNQSRVSFTDYLKERDRISRAVVEIGVEFLGLPEHATGNSPNTSEIKTLLSNGELKAALIRLNDDIPAAYQADVLWLMCRHELLRRDELMGILTRADFQLAQTKIMQEVLNIFDSTSKTQPKDQDDLPPEQLEQWFQDDKLKEILTYLSGKFPEEDKIILALSRLNALEKQNRLGTIAPQDWERQRTILRQTVRTLSEELGLQKPLLPFEFDGFVFVKTPDLLNGELSGKEDVIVRIARQKSDLAVGVNIQDTIESTRLTETLSVDLIPDSDQMVVAYRSKDVQDIPPTGVAEWKFGLTNATNKPLQALKVDIKLTKYDPDGRPAKSILSSVNIQIGEFFESKSTEPKPAAEKAAAPKLSKAEVLAKAKAASKRPPPKKK